jgi:hypothetical protein
VADDMGTGTDALTPRKPISCSHTAASPGCRAHWIMTRPIMSWLQVTQEISHLCPIAPMRTALLSTGCRAAKWTLCRQLMAAVHASAQEPCNSAQPHLVTVYTPQLSVPTMRTSGSLSMSASSATMWPRSPRRPPLSSLSFSPISERTVRSTLASACKRGACIRRTATEDLTAPPQAADCACCAPGSCRAMQADTCSNGAPAYPQPEILHRNNAGFRGRMHRIAALSREGCTHNKRNNSQLRSDNTCIYPCTVNSTQSGPGLHGHTWTAPRLHALSPPTPAAGRSPGAGCPSYVKFEQWQLSIRLPCQLRAAAQHPGCDWEHVVFRG